MQGTMIIIIQEQIQYHKIVWAKDGTVLRVEIAVLQLRQTRQL